MITSKKADRRCFVFCPNPSVDILATIPDLRAQQSNRIQKEERFPGGKGIHVALALAELEIPTTLIGLWGNKNGQWLIDACKEYYPNLEVIGPSVEGWNRSCFTFQSNQDWNDTELLGTGPAMKSEHFDMILEIISNRKEEMASLAICGSWPQGAAPKYNQKIVEHCQPLDIDVYLDCTGDQLKNALTANPFCVHLNRSEVTSYFDENFEASKDQMAQYCEVAAITDGAKGLYLYTKKENVHTNVKITNVKSTVGSGDCLMAGIIAGYFLGYTTTDIAKMGAACGAANCKRADLGMLHKYEVDELLPLVKSNSIT